MKKIVVLLSCYNGEKYLSCQIDSILNQTLDDVELSLFIRDDGSLDSTKEILKRYQKEYRNVQVIYGNNIGFVYSFFELIFLAKKRDFDFIAFSDQDDRWDSDKLKIAIEKIGLTDIPTLYESTVRITDENLNFKKIDQIDAKPITFFNSAIQNFAAGHTYVFNRSLLDEIKENIDCSRIFVHDAFVHNVAVLKGKVIFDRVPHNDYRQHSCNVLGASKSKGMIGWIKKRLKRIRSGESKLYAKQILYYSDYFGDKMPPDFKRELTAFFKMQRNFFTRFIYICKTKLYRQKRFETLSFKLLYLFGGFKISNEDSKK